MAATEPTFGMQHLTVVPTNFEPRESSDEPAASDDRDEEIESDETNQ